MYLRLNELFEIEVFDIQLCKQKPYIYTKQNYIVISWLQICHTRLTHSFILKQKPQPVFNLPDNLHG